MARVTCEQRDSEHEAASDIAVRIYMLILDLIPIALSNLSKGQEPVGGKEFVALARLFGGFLQILFFT